MEEKLAEILDLLWDINTKLAQIEEIFKELGYWEEVEDDYMEEET